MYSLLLLWVIEIIENVSNNEHNICLVANRFYSLGNTSCSKKFLTVSGDTE